jgi:hypothetical protein
MFLQHLNLYSNIFPRFFNILTSIPIYIQQDATLHSLFYLETAVHVSGVTVTHHL